MSHYTEIIPTIIVTVTINCNAGRNYRQFLDEKEREENEREQRYSF